MRIHGLTLCILLGTIAGSLAAADGVAAGATVAAERKRYLQTVERMKTIAGATQAYNTDNNSFPPADSLEAFKKALTPDYLAEESPWLDGWNHPFRVVGWDESQPAAPSQVVIMEPENPVANDRMKITVARAHSVPEVIHHFHYMLVSTGADGIQEKENLRDYREGWTASDDADMVMLDGEWLRRMKPAPEDWREAMTETRNRLFAITLAMQSYENDHGLLPDSEQLTELVALLHPDYLPSYLDVKNDGWGRPFHFLRWRDPPLPDGKPGKIHYRIASAGTDDRFEYDDLRAYSPRESADPREDVVIEDGHFLSEFIDPQQDDKTRVRRTLVKIKIVATTLEQYSSDHNQYPSGADYDAVLQNLGPHSEYSSELMRRDGWGRLIRYQSWGVKPSEKGTAHYCLASAGADRKWEFGSLTRYQPEPGTALNGQTSDDIVICDGQFVRQPE